MSNKLVRVRMSPSPTGALHVGGVRTALYNYLWAKRNKGKFILRIEDSDLARNSAGSYDNIIRSLDWLGLNPDEGPKNPGNCGSYIQSQKQDKYIAYAESLVAHDKAYRCSCSNQDLDNMKKDFENSHPKLTWKYPGLCRTKAIHKDKAKAIRFKVDQEYSTSFNDLVFGKLDVLNSSLYDFVIMRESQMPLYNFAAVIDDHEMNISLVARGKDHLINTTPQILLYKAFNWELPEFAHLPMLLDKDGKKLSKRNAAASVDQFKDMGFSANGLLNYLIRFGWAHKDKELFTMQEMIDLFSWEDCKRADGKFDPVKALAINSKNLINSGYVSDETYKQDLLNFTPLVDDKILKLVRHKSKSYKDAGEALSFLHDGSLDRNSDFDKDKLFIIKDLVNIYNDIEFTKQDLLYTTKGYCDSNDLDFKMVSQTIRHCVTKREFGLDIYDILEYLGKDKTLQLFIKEH